jgi:hypothetical protein
MYHGDRLVSASSGPSRALLKWADNGGGYHQKLMK